MARNKSKQQGAFGARRAYSAPLLEALTSHDRHLMTQVVAVLAIPVLVAVCFMYLGSSKMHGCFALVGGLLLLMALSIFKGALEVAWGYLFSGPAACTIREFYTLSGGLGCSSIPVAACYSFVVYGIVNLVLAYVRKAS